MPGADGPPVSTLAPSTLMPLPVSTQGWGLGTQADGPSPALERAACLAHVASSSSFDAAPSDGSGITGFWTCSRHALVTARGGASAAREPSPALSAVMRAGLGSRPSHVSPAHRVFLAITHREAGCAHAAVELSRCRLEAGSEGQTRPWPSCEGGGGMVTNAGLSAPTSLRGSGQWAFCFWFIFSVSN